MEHFRSFSYDSCLAAPGQWAKFLKTERYNVPRTKVTLCGQNLHQPGEDMEANLCFMDM